ncbi:hypothetical protein GCM10009540_42060 [Streptomyces turgidiscabies]
MRRAASARVRGPWDRTVVKISEAAGVRAGNASARMVEGMPGNLAYFPLSMKEALRRRTISGLASRLAKSRYGHPIDTRSMAALGFAR